MFGTIRSLVTFKRNVDEVGGLPLDEPSKEKWLTITRRGFSVERR